MSLDRDARRKEIRAAIAAANTRNGRGQRRGRNPETALTTAILDALAYVPGLEVWRNNSGKARGESGRLIQLGPVGSADILGGLIVSVYLDQAAAEVGEETVISRLIALEVKQPGKKPTAKQLAWAEKMRAIGTFYAVVDSIDSALAAIERARAGGLA